VKDETSSIEWKGGDFFSCEKCEEHIHTDVNTARNIISVHSGSVLVAVLVRYKTIFV